MRRLMLTAAALWLVAGSPAKASHTPFHTPERLALADVRVHGHGRTMYARLDHYTWCYGGDACMSGVVDYAASPRIRYLPIRGGRPLVVRTKLRAGSVTVGLYGERGTRVARVELLSLGIPGQVWRASLPPGIG